MTTTITAYTDPITAELLEMRSVLQDCPYGYHWRKAMYHIGKALAGRLVSHHYRFARKHYDMISSVDKTLSLQVRSIEKLIQTAAASGVDHFSMSLDCEVWSRIRKHFPFAKVSRDAHEASKVNISVQFK